MHVYPLVLTYGKNKKDAMDRVSCWVDDQFYAHRQSVYDYGGPLEPSRCDDPCRSAADDEVQGDIKVCLETEKNIFRENWAKLRAYVEAFKERDIPPMGFLSSDESETFTVVYKIAVGVSSITKSGTSVTRLDEPAWAGLYAARKLSNLQYCVEGGRGDFCVDAMLYTIDEESQRAIESGEWEGIWAVICDFHF